VTVAKQCCRSTPRCIGCPVRLAAAARARRTSSTSPAALVDIVFGGAPPRPLPPAVERALSDLDACRRPALSRVRSVYGAESREAPDSLGVGRP
jgi:hypothetical protein